MNYLINYRKEFREHFSNEITINEERVASALCIFSRPGMPVRRLGNFRLEFSPNDTDLLNLNQFIKQHNLNEKSTAYNPHRCGSRLVKFSIRDNDKWIIHSLPTLAQLPPPLDELETKLIEIMKKVAEHPLRSFYIEAKPDFYAVRPGDTVSIELIMNSSGQFPLKICNPASIARQGGSSLFFLVWSVNKLNADSESLEYYTTIDTAGLEFMRSPHETIASDIQYIEFAAKDELISFISLPFPKCLPGRYLLQLVYNSTGDLFKDNDLVFGGFHGDPIAIEVTK
jgi:hypothetical protein